MTTYRSLPAHPDHPAQEAIPPCGGSWVRNADGSLTPADESTAAAAGLLADQPAPAAPASASRAKATPQG